MPTQHTKTGTYRYAEGSGVPRDTEMATIFLWKAAGQRHGRAQAYLHDMQTRAHPCYCLKRLFCAKKKERASEITSPPASPASRLTGVEKATQDAEVAAATLTKAATQKAPADAEAALANRAALRRAISDHVSAVSEVARAEVAAERRARRASMEKLKGKLVDVTFTKDKLDIALVLATDHRTKRKMIIVEGVKEESMGYGLLEPQDELVAIRADASSTRVRSSCTRRMLLLDARRGVVVHRWPSATTSTCRTTS